MNSCTAVDFPITTPERLSFSDVTEIPEHLLKRSKAAKAKADGAEAPADAPAAASTAPATTAAAAAVPARAAAPVAPAAPVVKPDTPVVAAYKARQEGAGVGDGDAQHPARVGVHVRARAQAGDRQGHRPPGRRRQGVRHQLRRLPRRRRRGHRLGVRVHRRFGDEDLPAYRGSAALGVVRHQEVPGRRRECVRRPEPGWWRGHHRRERRPDARLARQPL